MQTDLWRLSRCLIWELHCPLMNVINVAYYIKKCHYNTIWFTFSGILLFCLALVSRSLTMMHDGKKSYERQVRQYHHQRVGWYGATESAYFKCPFFTRRVKTNNLHIRSVWYSIVIDLIYICFIEKSADNVALMTDGADLHVDLELHYLQISEFFFSNNGTSRRCR